MDINLKIENRLNLNQDLTYAISLLAMDNIGLARELARLAEENVFIDLSPNYIGWGEEGFDFDILKNKEDYREEILEEFILENSDQKEIYLAKYIIYSLDDRGFFDLSAEDLSNIDMKLLSRVLKKIQNLSIKGLATTCVKDFLIFQAGDEDLKAFIRENYEGILEGKVQAEGDFSKYLSKVRDFKLYPLENIGRSTETKYLYPDLFASFIDDKLTIELRDFYDFSINKRYEEMLGDLDKKDYDFMKAYYNKALLIKRGIEERRNNILAISRKLLEIQMGYVKYKQDKRPISMTDLAEDLNLSVSTISRVANNKVMDFEGRVFPLSDLFEKTASKNGRLVGRDTLLKELKKLVEGEDRENPLTDSDLADLLNKRGFDIKRRTIGKYRKELGIESSSRRKKIYLIEDGKK